MLVPIWKSAASRRRGGNTRTFGGRLLILVNATHARLYSQRIGLGKKLPRTGCSL